MKSTIIVLFFLVIHSIATDCGDCSWKDPKTGTYYDFSALASTTDYKISLDPNDPVCKFKSFERYYNYEQSR